MVKREVYAVTGGMGEGKATRRRVRSRVVGQILRPSNQKRLPVHWLGIAAGDLQQPCGGCSRRGRRPLGCAGGGAYDGPGSHLPGEPARLERLALLALTVIFPLGSLRQSGRTPAINLGRLVIEQVRHRDRFVGPADAGVIGIVHVAVRFSDLRPIPRRIHGHVGAVLALIACGQGGTAQEKKTKSYQHRNPRISAGPMIDTYNTECGGRDEPLAVVWQQRILTRRASTSGPCVIIRTCAMKREQAESSSQICPLIGY